MSVHGNGVGRKLEQYGKIFLLAGASSGPEIIEHNGLHLVRYMDRIYLPDRPSHLDTETLEDVSELRLMLGPELIDSRYTQQVLSSLYRRAIGSKEGSRLLDFGCGDGNIAALVLTLPRSKRPREIVGVDISERAVRLAQEKFASADLGTAVHVHSLEAMPLEEEYFDAAVANFVMHFPISPQQSVDIFRLLKPGAKFIYNDYQYFKDPGHSNFTIGLLRKAGFVVKSHYERFWRSSSHEIRNIKQKVVECSKPII